MYIIFCLASDFNIEAGPAGLLVRHHGRLSGRQHDLQPEGVSDSHNPSDAITCRLRLCSIGFPRMVFLPEVNCRDV